MSTDSTTTSPKTAATPRKRSNSRSRISKTEQRPRSGSKSRKATNTEPRKTKSSKSVTRDKSKSRSRKPIASPPKKTEEKVEEAAPTTHMVLRKRHPKDEGIEKNHSITPKENVFQEEPKEVKASTGSALHNHITSHKYLYFMTFIILLLITLIVFNGYDMQKYINQFQIKITRFIETQRRKIAAMRKH